MKQTKKAPPGKKAAKKKARQANLAFGMTGPEVQKALGGVSHVTVHNLTFKQKLIKRLGKAKQSGGGYLWDRESVMKLAKTYKAQSNPPPGQGKYSRRAKRAKKARKKIRAAVDTPRGRKRARAKA